MLRWLYIQLIWLHPAAFRCRFGEEMLDDFDRARFRDKPGYFADALASLARQWLLRPEFRRLDEQTATLRTAGIPVFETIADYKPCPAALLQGGLLGIVSMLAPVVLIGMGGGAKLFLIGAHFSRPGLLPINRSSVPGKDLNTSVDVGPDAIDRWLKLAKPYFGSMPVLRALDSDGNFTLSPSEISSAPAALRKLDTNHDGKITAEECGWGIAPNFVSAAMQAEVHRRFMTYHPVLAVLDADRDGVISAWEIDHAAAALENLDLNHDGYVTPDELIPFDIAKHAGLR